MTKEYKDPTTKQFERPVLKAQDLRAQQEAEETLHGTKNDAPDSVAVLGDQEVSLTSLYGGERAYRTLVEQMNEGAAVLRSDGAISYCNSRLSTMLRTPMEMIIGTSLRNFVHPAHVRTFDALFEQGFRESSKGELQLITSDDESVPACLSCRTLQIEYVNCLCVVVADITKIKQAEERLRGANRALRVLGEFSRVMVGCTDEFHLLNEACRIIVEKGGYRMAWVGFVVHDEEQSVIPVAHSGYRDRHFDGLHISLTDEKSGQGPMATTIRSGRISIVRDILANRSLAHMHERARRGGLSSLIVLPITIGENPIGGLAVWASEPEAYDDEETRFLVELAENISYGYTSIKTSAEWKRTEDELRAVQEQYKQVVETQTELVCRFRPDSTLTFVNEAFCRQFGKTSEELVGRSLVPLIPEESLKAASRQLSSFDRTHPVANFETQLIKPEGSRAWYEWTTKAIFDDQGKAVEFQSVGRDITDRKLTEKELRLSEERFRAIFENARDFIYVKDRARKYTHVNPPLEGLHGLPASRIVGRTDVELFSKEAEAYIRDADERVLAGQSIDEQHTVPFAGVSRTFHDVKVPMYDHSGSIIGLLGISREITDRTVREPMSFSGDDQYPSKAMRATLKKARQAAMTESVVVLLGESGSGKDYLARYIHEHSKRASGPFFVLNCAAVSPELAESELFGHERGSFTGAYGRKRGLLELAEGGTLLLNEVGELSLALQSKLLTFLDTRSFTRVGGEKNVSINARLIAATNKELQLEVQSGRFRQDLFYRLNVISIEVPPLRERKEDLPVLVDELVRQLATEMQIHDVPAVDAAGMRALAQYSWPGNVRELRNVLERTLMLSGGGPLKVALHGFESGPAAPNDIGRLPAGRTLAEVTDEVTKALCLDALRRCNGNKRRAAKLLGIARDTLYRYMRQFGLEPDSWTQ